MPAVSHFFFETKVYSTSRKLNKIANIQPYLLNCCYWDKIQRANFSLRKATAAATSGLILMNLGEITLLVTGSSYTFMIRKKTFIHVKSLSMHKVN